MQMLQKKYAKQFGRFKKQLKKMKKSFAENKGLLFNMFILPILLSGLACFFYIRKMLRVFMAEGCGGYDWDQAQLKQTRY